mmetsp:Transcript_5243/g.17409  ORF Transcript_5243/g.17409 Transcript_5243/m.17409 type:complete len:163 (+) Transcript_5243:1249-1737(+)|eukprot:scaffold14794_cov96-Isochrysis_galbana.AAC.5
MERGGIAERAVIPPKVAANARHGAGPAVNGAAGTPNAPAAAPNELNNPSPSFGGGFAEMGWPVANEPNEEAPPDVALPNPHPDAAAPANPPPDEATAANPIRADGAVEKAMPELAANGLDAATAGAAASAAAPKTVVPAFEGPASGVVAPKMAAGGAPKVDS